MAKMNERDNPNADGLEEQKQMVNLNTQEEFNPKEKEILDILKKFADEEENDDKIQRVLNRFGVKEFRKQMVEFDFDEWNDQFRDNLHRDVARMLAHVTSPSVPVEDPYEWVDRFPYNLFYKRVQNKHDKPQKYQSKKTDVQEHINNQEQKK